MTSFVETFIGAVRPLQLKGKGFLFQFVTPRTGARSVEVWGDYRMTLDLANVIHRQIFMGCFGRYMTVCTRALLRPGGTFLDVGAHAGYFTLLASHCVGPAGRVYALEPTPPTFAALKDHLQTNGVVNVRAEMIALGEEPGTLRLFVPPLSERRDYNVTYIPRADWLALDVACRKLDECVAEWDIRNIDLMKMDVEGAEPRVLAGGAESLRSGIVKHLIVEVNGPRLSEGGSSPEKLIAQLAGLGFLPARIVGKRVVTISADRWDLDPAHEYDRLFVHNSIQ